MTSVNDFVFGGIPVDLGELAVMEYEQDRVHQGEMFASHYYAGTLASNGTLMFHVGAGTVSPHLLWHVSIGGDARITVTEGGTVTGGTAVAVYNMNRNKSGSCLATVSHSGTLTGGTVIRDEFIPGGSGPQASGGARRADEELIALASKTTSITVENITTAYPASVGVVFYEENE